MTWITVLWIIITTTGGWGLIFLTAPEDGTKFAGGFMCIVAGIWAILLGIFMLGGTLL